MFEDFKARYCASPQGKTKVFLNTYVSARIS